MSIDQPSGHKQNNLMHRQSRDGRPLWPTVRIMAFSISKFTKITQQGHRRSPHKGLYQSLNVYRIAISRHSTTRRPATIPIETPS